MDAQAAVWRNDNPSGPRASAIRNQAAPSTSSRLRWNRLGLQRQTIEVEADGKPLQQRGKLARQNRCCVWHLPLESSRPASGLIVPDPLVGPGNPTHCDQARATTHRTCTRPRLVALATRSPSYRPTGASQWKIATVMLGSIALENGFPTFLHDRAPAGLIDTLGAGRAFRTKRKPLRAKALLQLPSNLRDFQKSCTAPAFRSGCPKGSSGNS